MRVPPSRTPRPQACEFVFHDISFMSLHGAQNYSSVAAMFGRGATYDSIEGRFRGIKKQAKVLREEIQSGARPADAPMTPRKRRAQTGELGPITPRSNKKKKLDASAPVPTTALPSTPSRRKIKTEVEEEEQVVDAETPSEHWSAASDSPETEEDLYVSLEEE